MPRNRLSKTGNLTARITVTLPPEILEYLRELGAGNVSKGIREVVKREQEAHDNL